MFYFLKLFFYEIKKLSSMKEKKEIEILRFFDLFLKIQKIGVIYRADKIGERADPWPILISALKDGEVKLFQIY